eukprot:631595-Ditylum_brightwellii.AAC.1
MTPEQAIHHTGLVWIASIEQDKGHTYLLGVLDNWDQTHSLINKVSGATNSKFPNIVVAFSKMPQLLSGYKAKFDGALQSHKESQAAK